MTITITKGAPSAPTLTQLNQDVNGDGTIDIAISVTLATLVAGASRYEIELSRSATSGGTYTVFKNQTVSQFPYSFAANTSWYYKARVRSFDKDGNPSSWGSLSSALQPVKKAATVTVPTSLTATARPRGQRLVASKSTEADYKETVFYRHTSNAIGSATEIGRVSGTVYVDTESLTVGATYYYWCAYVDRSGNVSAKYPAVNGVSVVHAAVATADIASGAVTDDKADQTAPGTPGVPSVTSITADIDGDGKLDTGVTVAYTAPGSGVPVRYYRVELHEATAVGGTYSLVQSVVTSELSHIFKTKRNRFYKARALAISFSGVKGSYSALTTTGVQPSGKASATAPTSLTATARPRGQRLVWSVSTETDYKETVIYRHTADAIGSAVEVDRISGTTYLDQSALTIGTTYYYWVSHVDRSGNVSAKYPAVNGVSVTHAAVVASDTDATALAAPASAPTLTQLNQDVNGDGTVDIAISVSLSSGVTGAVRYEAEISRSTTSGGTYTVIDNRVVTQFPFAFIANTSFFYKVRVRAFNAFGAPGSWSALSSALQPVAGTTAPDAPTGLSVVGSGFGWAEVQWNQSPRKDFKYALLMKCPTSSYDSGAVGYEEILASGNRHTFKSDSAATVYVWVAFYDTRGNLSGTYPSLVSSGVAVTIPGTISTSQLANGSVSTGGFGEASGNLSVGTSYTDSNTVTCSVTDARYMQFGVRFQAVAAGTFDVQVRQNITEVFAVTGVVLAAGEVYSSYEAYNASALPGSSDQFTLRVKRSSGTGNVAQRRLSVINIKK